MVQRLTTFVWLISFHDEGLQCKTENTKVPNQAVRFAPLHTLGFSAPRTLCGALKCTLGEEKKEHHSLAALSLPKVTRTKVLTLCLQAVRVKQPRISGSHSLPQQHCSPQIRQEGLCTHEVGWCPSQGCRGPCQLAVAANQGLRS